MEWKRVRSNTSQSVGILICFCADVHVPFKLVSLKTSASNGRRPPYNGGAWPLGSVQVCSLKCLIRPVCLRVCRVVPKTTENSLTHEMDPTTVLLDNGDSSND